MIARGVAVIYQEPSLAPHLTRRREHLHGPPADHRAAASSTGAAWPRTPRVVAERLGLELEPRDAGRHAQRGSPPDGRDRQGAVARRPADRARRAVGRPGRRRAGGLFRVMRRLAEKGVAFVYISHRLNEVFRITDRVMVMKDGRVVATEPTAAMTPDGSSGSWSGATSDGSTGRARRAARRPAWRCAVRGLTRAGRVPRHRSDGRAPARSSAIAGLAGAGPDRGRCGRSTAPTRSTRARSRSSAARSASARRARRSRWASAC